MKSIEYKKIRNRYYLAGLIVILIMLASFSVPYAFSMKEEYETKIEQLSQSIISEKKRYARDTVYRTIFDIESTRTTVISEYGDIAKTIANMIAAVISQSDYRSATQSDSSEAARRIRRALPLFPESSIDYVVIASHCCPVKLKGKSL